MYKILQILFFMSCLSWLSVVSLKLFDNSKELLRLSELTAELKTQNALYDTKVAELVMKQDRRITLLEDLIEQESTHDQ